MGFSYTLAVGDLMSDWERACLAHTDIQNVFDWGGSRYMLEIERSEHEDGHVEGQLYLLLKNGMCRPGPRFTILPDGMLSTSSVTLRQFTNHARRKRA